MAMPVLKVQKYSLPEAWESAVLGCWNEGIRIPTEYDKESDPDSRDCTMIIIVGNPFAEPRIHRSIPCGLDDLEIYRQEVLFGVHDRWIDPEAGKWSHTYHERLFKYGLPTPKDSECGQLLRGRAINQIEGVIKKLKEASFTRRAQATIWKPWVDPQDEHAPCLQRLWYRIINDRLICNAHIRSNDAYKAAFMNLFAFSALQGEIAARLSQELGREIKVGQLTWIADSFHIYGAYFKEFEDRFLRLVRERTYAERTWTSEFAESFFEDGRIRLEKELKN